MRLIQTLSLILMTLTGFAQKPMTYVRLSILDLSERPLATEISFKRTPDNEVLKTKTSNTGQGSIVIKKGYLYIVTAVGSSDQFEIELPELSEDTIDLELTFETFPNEPLFVNTAPVSAVDTNLVGLYVFDKPNGVKLTWRLTAASAKNELAAKESKLKIPVGQPFVLEAQGVYIKYCEILQTSFSADMVKFALYFERPDTASLVEIKNEGAVFFTFWDLYDVRTPEETIMLKSKKSNKIFRAKTNGNGVANLFVPLDDTYLLSLTYCDSLSTIIIGKEKNVFHYVDFKIEAPSAFQIEDAKAKRERLAFVQDSVFKVKEKEYLAFQDSMRVVIKLYEDSLEKERRLIISDTTTIPITITEGLAIKPDLLSLPISLNKPLLNIEIEDGFKRDSSFFVKNRLEILSAFYRNREQWKDKIIVTDVTGSMYPYTQQLLIWHKLFPQSISYTTFSLFFNDGDNKPDKYKVMGRIGGIYMTTSSEFDSIQACMAYTSIKGCGGDAPENNVEALLVAQTIKNFSLDQSTEIIMIADNYAPVKDLHLIFKVKVPIRIVLCGAKDNWINPDYLYIAWKTNGSIHTIEEDILDLARVRNGDILSISGRRYKLVNGTFYELTRG